MRIRFEMSHALVAALSFLGVLLIIGTSATHAEVVRRDHLRGERQGVLAVAPEAEGATWVSTREGSYFRHPLTIVELTATTPDSPVPPGIRQLPGPGERVISPALSRVLANDDTGKLVLATRVPGRTVGLINATGLTDARELVAYVGLSSPGPIAQSVVRFEDPTPQRGSEGLILGLLLGAIGVPVLTCVGLAARVAAPRREARWAALWLLGYSTDRLRRTEVLGMGSAAAAGALIGAYVAYHFSATWASWTLGSSSDAAGASLATAVAALAGVTISAAAVAAYAIPWSGQEALSAIRSVSSARRTRAVSLAALPVGFVMLAGCAMVGGRRDPGQTIRPVERWFVQLSLVLVVLGCLAVAPILVRWVGGQLSRSSSLVATVAGRRLLASPVASTRSAAMLLATLTLGVLLQGIVVLYASAADRAPVASQAIGRVLVQGPEEIESRLSKIEGVDSVALGGAEPGRPDCVEIGFRFCSFVIETNGSPLVPEYIRSTFFKDPSVEVVGWLDPQPQSPTDGYAAVARVTMGGVIALVACALSLATVDAVLTRRLSSRALRAIGVPTVLLLKSLLLSLLVPLSVVIAAGLSLGWVCLRLVSHFMQLNLTMGWTWPVLVGALMFVLSFLAFIVVAPVMVHQSRPAAIRLEY